VWAEMKSSRLAALLFVSLAGFVPRARANVSVLLEEPYSYDGAFAGTGHTAVYLDNVCADTPVILRRCNPGEHGVVISRYARVAGYDWIAIPLIPYLYAVDNPEDIPLYADSKLEAFLRDQYRRAHLEELAPDAPGGETPKGDWYELVGSSYDRTNYGFEIESTPEQDDAFIAWMNSRPNHASYHFVSHNCADFVREVLNLYYPKSESRGNIADLFVSTPKRAAKSLVTYTKHHPDLEYTHFVIPQVPGSVRRSRPVRGVLESVFRAKKYVVALAAFHPFIVGGVVAVYVVGDRFNPARNAEVFSMSGEPEAAPTKAERRAYLKQLQIVASGKMDREDGLSEITWKKFAEKAQPEYSADGQLGLESSEGNDVVEVGITRKDLPSVESPYQLQRGLMLARLKQSLAHSRAPRISDSELHEDWQLLEKIDVAGQQRFSRKLEEGNRSADQMVEHTSD